MKYTFLSILLVTFIILPINSTNLQPINHCLANCNICQINQLTTCSGKQFVDCQKGFQGPNCTLKPTYASQILLMTTTQSLQNPQWTNTSQTICSYQNTKSQQIAITILGLYAQGQGNSIILDVLPYFSHFILSFNLIRNDWNPGNDTVKVNIVDQNLNRISEYVISITGEDNISTILNPLVCNQQTYIIQKYQISGTISPSISKKITISFDGITSIGANWGITNVKFISGCSNMLVFDGNDCQLCEDGFYPLSYPNSSIEACAVCPLNCLTCTDAIFCNSCVQGYTLQNGKCQSNYTLLMIPIISITPTICQNISLFSSNTINKQQSLEIQLSYLPIHQNQIRIQFYLAYTPTEFLDTDKITIQIDNNLDIIQILGTQLNSLISAPKQICNNFGTQGYFSYYKIISNYFQHNSTTINISITINNPRKIGVSQVGFQYQSFTAFSIMPNITLPTFPTMPTFPIIPNFTTPAIDKEIFQNIFNNSQTNFSFATDFNSVLIAIKQLQLINSSLKLGIKSGNKLIITIRYPHQFKKFPQYSAHLIKKNLTITPQTLIQTPQYQQLAFTLTDSILNQQIQLYMYEDSPIISYNNLYSNLTVGFPLTKVSVKRYDQVSYKSIHNYQQFGRFFQAMSWIAIILTLVFSIFGYGVITYKYYMLLQIVFLHVYIDTQYLPTNFKIIVGGLYRIQNFNYFTKSASNAIEKFLLGNVLQLSPAKFTQFTKDINFTRAIYPSIIAIIIYGISFLILNALRKYIQRRDQFQQADQQQTILDKIQKQICNISQRYLNYWYKIWQYLYLTFVFAIFVQFYNLNYPQGSNRSAVPNDMFCFVCFVIVIALPIATFLFLHFKVNDMEYSDYSYWYEDIFFQRLTTESVPSNQHRIYLLISNARYILLAICFAFLGNFPIAAVLIIILIHALNLFYSIFFSIQMKFINKIFTIIEHTFLIILSFLILISYCVSSSISTSHYMSLGFVMVVICLLLVILGLITVFYNILYKIKENKSYQEFSNFKPTVGTERGA